jgi:hypothetical protein
MDWLKWGTMQVGMLYKVPAIEMGIYDKTRFDTAAEERKLFVESTLMPQMNMVGEAIQQQIIDPHFSFSPSSSSRKKASLSKAMDGAYEQARYDRPDSQIIVLLDADALPIMNSVNLMKVEQAKGLREVLDLSAMEAAEFVMLDIPDRKEREDVWIKDDRVNITHPEFNHKLQPKPEPAAAKPSGSKPKPKKELTAEQREQVKSVDKAIRKLRKLTFDRLDNGELWSLEEADELAKDDAMKRPVRRIRHKIREIVEQFQPEDGRKDEIKFYFNSLDAKTLLGL